MSSATFNPRATARWRAAGHYVETTEHFVRLPGGRSHRKDLFGFVDLIATPKYNDDWPMVFLQVTSWDHISTRLKKIREEKTGRGEFEYPIRFIAADLLRRGNRIVIEGWRKGANGRWEFKDREVTLDDLKGDT